MKTIQEIALERFPENWQNEPYSHAHCPLQYDVNKVERDAFIEGLEYFNGMLKGNLSIDISSDLITDYGRIYNNITVTLFFGSDKISTSGITIDQP